MSIHRLVDEVKQRGLVSVGPSASVYFAVQKMENRGHSALLVMEGDKIEGIVTTNDVAFRLILKGKSPTSTPVKDIMTSPVHKLKVGPHTLLEECLAIMVSERVRHLPLIVDDEVVGLVTVLLVAKYRYDEQIRRAMETGGAMNFPT